MNPTDLELKARLDEIAKNNQYIRLACVWVESPWNKPDILIQLISLTADNCRECLEEIVVTKENFPELHSIVFSLRKSNFNKWIAQLKITNRVVDYLEGLSEITCISVILQKTRKQQFRGQNNWLIKEANDPVRTFNQVTDNELKESRRKLGLTLILY